MFTIVISEKGGAERRETFERTEISVGRVQGNDLMLPKGNVSKHHARLLFRDARFIVTDLKSTNGTYVNGRKIAQATIVREGDKIYIGDFVLRVETAQGAAAPESGRESPREAPRAEASGAGARPSPSSQEGASLPPSSTPMLAASIPPNSAPGLQVAIVAPPPARPPEPSAVSHYPLERDPDSESAPELRGAPIPRVPGPPRLPQATDLRSRSAVTTALAASEQRGSTAPSRKTTALAPLRSPVPIGDRTSPRETPQQAARRLALITLVDRVADVVDIGPLDRSPDVSDEMLSRVDLAARDQANAMRAEGEAPQGIDAEKLARDAVRELVGLGPIGPLLEDDDIAEIHVARADCVLVTRGGQTTLAEASFTSEDAVARVVGRLARQAGEGIAPGETFVERQLAAGTSLVAIGPPAASGWVFTIRKRRRVESSLDELVRAGALSRSMAVFLETCVGARANVLVAASGSGVAATMLGALACAAPAGERMTVLQDQDEIVIPTAQTIALSLTHRDARGEVGLHAAARLGADRLVVASLAGAIAAATIEAVAEGSDGLLAAVAAPSLRHGLVRLAAQMAIARRGASLDAVRDAISESFDVAIEAVRNADGKLRVLRIAELHGVEPKGIATRDIFVANAGGTGDASFAPTGATPRLAADLAARGIRLDDALFRKAK